MRDWTGWSPTKLDINFLTYFNYFTDIREGRAVALLRRRGSSGASRNIRPYFRLASSGVHRRNAFKIEVIYITIDDYYICIFNK